MKNLIAIIIILGFASCESYGPAPECNTSAELKELSYQSKEYKSIVIDYLKNSESADFRYFFKTFIDNGDETFMLTNFRNADNCFDAEIKVDKWSKLSGMRKVNGKSYPKELRNLKWKMTENNTLIYLDMNTIID